MFLNVDTQITYKILDSLTCWYTIIIVVVVVAFNNDNHVHSLICNSLSKYN